MFLRSGSRFRGHVPTNSRRDRFLGNRCDAFGASPGSGFNCVRGFKTLDLVGEFRHAWLRCLIGCARRKGQTILQSIAQIGELGAVSLVGKRFAQARIVVAKLSPGQREIPPGLFKLSVVATGEAFQSILEPPVGRDGRAKDLCVGELIPPIKRRARNLDEGRCRTPGRETGPAESVLYQTLAQAAH